MNRNKRRTEAKYLCIFVVMVLIIVATSNCLVFIKIFKDVEKNYKEAELNKTIMYSEQLNNFIIVSNYQNQSLLFVQVYL